MIDQAKTETPAGESNGAGAYGGSTPRGNQLRRFRIAGDVIARSTADLPERHRSALRWLAQYAGKNNLTNEEAGARLRQMNGQPYSGDSIYQALTGRREADQLGNLVRAIERLRKVEEARGEQVETGFIETAIARRVFQACRRAFLRRKIIYILGESQIGKTTSLEEYERRHNHGETYLVRMPTRPTITTFVRELAHRLQIPEGHTSTDHMRRRIIASFDDRMLLIVDEAHEVFTAGHARAGTRGLDVLNFIREIHDRRKCGIVISATNVFREQVLHGRHARNLRQLWLRGMAPVQLPARPGKRDLERFAAAYGLDAAPDEEIGIRVSYLDEEGNDRVRSLAHNPARLQAEVIGEYGLGRWNTILQSASDTAREKRRGMSWGLVIHAWHEWERFSAAEEGGAG